MKLLERIAAIAQLDPARLAYRDARDGRSVTYASLYASIVRVAANAPAAGSTVILCTPNRIEFAGVFVGLLSAGVSVLPVIGTTTQSELDAIASRVRASFITYDLATFDGDRVEPRFGPPGALLLASSGSTGVPKIVRRSAASLDAVSENMVEAIGIGADDHVLAAVPLAHSYGLEHGLLAPLLAGATTTLCDGLDLPAIVATLARGDVTILPTVPAVIERLVDLDEIAGLRSVRTIYSAGGPLPDAVRDRFVARYGVPIGQLYGSTEIGTVCYRRGDEGHGVGRPMRGVSVRIVDGGEVAIRAPSMFIGYVDEPAPLVDGHFLTGDLGHVDADGSLVLTGRSKLLIDTGGPKVDPLEVEAVLASHARVAECVVVALRQSETVSRLRAIVVLRGPATAEELRAFARERLAPHKVPRVVDLRDAPLPRSAAGKIARHLLENS